MYENSISKASKDAFPNAGQLFRDTFALPDPAPALVVLLKAHPTYNALVNLVCHYTLAAHENPSRANALAAALATVRDSPDAPVTDGDDVQWILAEEIPESHSYGFDSKDKLIVPTNKFLLTSLLSGFSFKYHLGSSPKQYGILWSSFGDIADCQTTEVRVIGACIQLLTSGSIIFPGSEYYAATANEAATKLMATKSKGVVKDSNAIKVLELAISHAETGFKRENDIDNVWEVLFPQT
ncbi:hypothetical protein M413DRAFT_347420 [Hebeloma cylindrosporum]|uniref:Uncharacterized protein n=1 Tax=Hebeloma cylindrosporum TaxID=76867 RepID=A0A0C3BFH5_HEBCY|nr:hypothetical protein M413DRAFT_347420 [Hebeloma cylindrosporum h7]